MHIALKQLPLTGEGSGGGEAAPLAPVPTFPRQERRGLDRPLSADPLPEGEGIGLQAGFRDSDAHPVVARSLLFRTKTARICANACER